jgi:hypothetical protein
MELTIFVGFQAVLLVVFVFLFTRMENRLEKRIDGIVYEIGGIRHSISEFRTRDLPALRHDLAEEFRAQRAEVAAQVTAIAAAINASKT